jgi:hypothetical protein
MPTPGQGQADTSSAGIRDIGGKGLINDTEKVVDLCLEKLKQDTRWSLNERSRL